MLRVRIIFGTNDAFRAPLVPKIIQPISLPLVRGRGGWGTTPAPNAASFSSRAEKNQVTWWISLSIRVCIVCDRTKTNVENILTSGLYSAITTSGFGLVGGVRVGRSDVSIGQVIVKVCGFNLNEGGLSWQCGVNIGERNSGGDRLRRILIND